MRSQKLILLFLNRHALRLIRLSESSGEYVHLHSVA